MGARKPIVTEDAALLAERDRLRVELERAEQRHRQLVELVPALVLGLDRAGRITIWNHRLEALTGHSHDEMIGRDGLALTAEDDAPCTLPVKDGPDRLVKWQVTRMDDGASLAVGVDVTHEQQMLRRTLRAERLAAVGTMAAGLAHEIRNPLNAALLQLTLLSRRLEKPTVGVADLRTIAGVVQAEIQRLERLVDDFLSFARPRALVIEAVDINQVCEGVLRLVEPEARKADVALVTALDVAVPFVEGDPERLHQVMLNLVRNGIEAIQDGGTLTVRTRKVDQGIEVDVEDTGPGIADESAIFDAFYTTKPNGTGLGLALVHRIVSDHGGDVSVASRPGCTCLTVFLPPESS